MMVRSAIIWRVKCRQKAVYSILQKQNVAFNVICLVLVPERFKPMHARFFLLIFTTLWAFSCRPSGPEEIPLPTKICLLTSHHGQPIPRAKVWIKYNTDTFPGYQQPPSFFDASFETGADAHGCIAPVPEGQHWLIAFGYDSLHYPNYVYGSMLVQVSVAYKPVIDTIMYVSE